MRNLSRGAVAMLALRVGACSFAALPKVVKSVSYDENGRAVVSYRICDSSPILGAASCRTETVVHNYCYRSLGRVDCYEMPQPGRTAMRTTP